MLTDANVRRASLLADVHNNEYEGMRLVAIMPSAYTGNSSSNWEQFSDHVICKITLKINTAEFMYFDFIDLCRSHQKDANIFLDHLPYVKGHRDSRAAVSMKIRNSSSPSRGNHVTNTAWCPLVRTAHLRYSVEISYLGKKTIHWESKK